MLKQLILIILILSPNITPGEVWMKGNIDQFLPYRGFLFQRIMLKIQGFFGTLKQKENKYKKKEVQGGNRWIFLKNFKFLAELFDCHKGSKSLHVPTSLEFTLTIILILEIH